MPYKLKANLATMPGPAELKQLIQRAVLAANRGEAFDETVDARFQGKPHRFYAVVEYNGGKPVAVIMGQDHSNLMSPEVVAEAKSTPGLTLNTREQWSRIRLVRS
jgi:hypothetical protein